MEEILTLKELLLQGDIGGALAIVEELEEMTKDDIINNIGSYGIILLLHLIKQEVENRQTRSWDVSIRNSVLAIRKLNKRRKAGGVYLPPEELRLALAEAYAEAINQASLEVANGIYEVEELSRMVDENVIIERGLGLILAAE
ncbi:MAG TPA: DUF29 family protein [Oscillatoriaceae cyanobacterium M33_DOE_052]|uniref:DUF29 family protein n=1 Tax=Planktothricoides sp. SpSt-374 TaxID=2282167 RepID=A0A7C3ZEU3_9CYAN|nr:DUF29 family protein [Oscillatoriaceae cyanobacterium M33_DOE_052]